MEQVNLNVPPATPASQAFNPTPTPASQSFNWKDFISFRNMITLQVIQIVYVVVAILITLGALLSIFGNGSYYSPMAYLGGGGVLGGLIMLVLGNIIWRMWCELIIVFFRMNKTLSNIEHRSGM
jgi:Domain of unknown function (DUF4282)